MKMTTLDPAIEPIDQYHPFVNRSSINRLRFAILMIAALVGCSRPNGPRAQSTTASDESSDIVAVDPSDVLFTTPTLNNATPTTLKGSVVPSDCIRIHEDDWRQFEFIAASLKAKVSAELADIRVIWDEKAVPLRDSGTGFRETHVRKRIPNPLPFSMSLADFETFVGQETGPMTFFGYDEVLRDVHAVRIDKLVVYALVQEGTVKTVGLNAVEPFSLPSDFLDRLSKFVQDRNLVLVHWRGCTLYETHQDVLAYLRASNR